MSWAQLFYINAKIHVQKQTQFWIAANVPSLFHEIDITTQAYLPVLHMLKYSYATVVQVNFSILQPCMHSLLDCFVFTVLTFHVILYEPEQVVAQRGGVQIIEKMGDNFPAKLFNFPWCQACSVRVCIMLKNDVSFHWMFVTKCTSQFLEYLNITNCSDSFLSVHEINQYAPLDIPENSCHNFSSWENGSGLLPLKRCSMMPFHILSFCFGGQNTGTNFHH